MTGDLVRVLGFVAWRVDVRWPDGRREVFDVAADDAAAAEQYARDIWGASITATARPARESA